MRRLLLSAAFLLPLPALAENHALIVAASTYPGLEERFWLKGPANDAELVTRYLTENPAMPFARENITVLADGLPTADGDPTLSAIRLAFADLAATVGPGDFVYLHFSGHGSQSPALDPSTEIDGLDEMFLPVDVGPWNDTVGMVQNALVDDEIGAMIDAIRAQGADVWAVFDACHSGTITRAASSGDEEVATRQLTPDALGIPQSVLDEIEETASRALPDPDPRDRPPAPLDVTEGDGMGALVAFFAAQSTEVTIEKRLPAGDPDRRAQGVFTWAIFETLAERPGLTYRQLGQEVLRKYAVRNMARSTPLFEGDLDRPVFGGEGGGRLAQWPAEVQGDAVTLRAGTLHGLSTGARLAVLRSPADTTDAALGFVEVTRADTFGATVTPVAAEGLPAPALTDIPRGAYLRKMGAPLDFSLTVALPEGDGDPQALMRRVARALADDPETGARLVFVEPGAEADIRLAVLPDSPRPDALWFLPASGLVDDLATTPSISTADKTEGDFAATAADSFARIARAVNLMKIGGATGAGSLDATADIYRARFDATAGAVDEQSRAPVDGAEVPRMVPDDVIGLRATNPGDIPVDINVLYVGADWSISWMYNARMPPGAELSEDLILITDENFGRDRMVVVFTPVTDGQRATEDLSFLEQDALDVTRGDASPTALLLAEAGFGQTTRGAVSLASRTRQEPGPAILQFEIDTIPAP